MTRVQTALERAIEWQAYFSWESDAENQQLLPDPFSRILPFVYEYEQWPAIWNAGDITFQLLQRWNCIEPYALKLMVLEQDKRLQLELHYDTARFSLPSITRIASTIQTLLQSVCLRPEQPVLRLPLLDQEQAAWIALQLRPVPTPQPPTTWQQLFAQQAACTPEQQAVVCGTEHLSYGELEQQANQLAHCLRAHGVQPQELVGLLVSRSVAWLVGMLGILKAGAVYVALDPELPPARLQRQLQQCESRWLVTQTALQERLSDWTGSSWCLDGSGEQQEQRQAPVSTPTLAEAAQDEQALAMVIFTSGSTGEPKGVLVRQQSVVNYTLALQQTLKVEPGWHYGLVSTLAADLGNTALLPALTSGGCVHMLSYETATSGAALARYAEQQPLDVLKIVPSHLQALLQGQQEASWLPRRALVLGGEALRPGLLAQIREQGARCQVFNHYGPTEATIGALMHPITEDAGDEDEETLPIGRPLPNVEAYVFDQGGQEVPVGMAGELYLGGVGLAAGYVRAPQASAERFVPHPGQPGERLYRTGDRVRLNERGELVFCGRVDRQVKLRGHRIELGEIEAALRQHANVRECVVRLVQQEEQEPRLVGYIVPRSQPVPERQELRAFLQELLPEVMIPWAVVSLPPSL